MKAGIIGGGASGLAAAITAACGGCDVTVLEHKDRVGKKLLLTGNGRCNLTNLDQDISHYHGADNEFIGRVLKAFSFEDTLAFFEDLGLFYKERNGCVYPFCDKASAVLDLLRLRLNELKVNVVTDCEVSAVIPKSGGFLIKSSKGDYGFDKLIIAAGSKAAENTGSDGSGYRLAESLSHTVLKPYPALCALRCREKFMKSLSGIRTRARVNLMIDGFKEASDLGELQLTDYGISGIPVFQISYMAGPAIDKGRSVECHIDFMPDMAETDELIAYLTGRKDMMPLRPVSDFMTGLLNKKLSALIIRLSGIDDKKLSGNMSEDEIRILSDLIKDLTLTVTGTNPFMSAQVCSGGISCDELTDGLESRLHKGLYFAGEIIDVNGDCGGYNLQWAWSSGAVAGRLG